MESILHGIQKEGRKGRIGLEVGVWSGGGGGGGGGSVNRCEEAPIGVGREDVGLCLPPETVRGLG